MLKVDEIYNGVVIDHIKGGTGLKIYRMLHLENYKGSVALLQNVHSRKYRTKDLIKIDGKDLPERLSILGYIDSNITLIFIEDGKIIKKERPGLPKRMVNVIRCSNPRCITSIESGCDHIFEMTQGNKYRCVYCNAEYAYES